jgi:hypothetical protein
MSFVEAKLTDWRQDDGKERDAHFLWLPQNPCLFANRDCFDKNWFCDVDRRLNHLIRQCHLQRKTSRNPRCCRKLILESTKYTYAPESTSWWREIPRPEVVWTSTSKVTTHVAWSHVAHSHVRAHVAHHVSLVAHHLEIKNITKCDPLFNILESNIHYWAFAAAVAACLASC